MEMKEKLSAFYSAGRGVEDFIETFGQEAVRLLAVGVALVEEKEKLLDRKVVRKERDWLIRKAFTCRDGHEKGKALADCVITMMDGIGWRNE